MKMHVRSLVLLSGGLLGLLRSTAVVAAPTPTAHVAQFKGDRVASLSFTFDDGWEDAASVGAPLLERYGMRGTFFIVSGVLSEENHPVTKNNYGHVPWKRWRQIAMAGHEIGNHSFDHAMEFTKADDEKLRSEIVGGHDLIRDKIGIAPVSFALPSSNTLNPWTRAVIDSCHLFTRVDITGYGGKKCTVESANALADTAIAKKKQMTTLFHAVENGYDAFSSAAVFEGHLAYVKTLQDRLWVDTFGHVNMYVKERNAAKLEAKPIEGGISFVLTTPLDPQVYTAPLTVVIDAPGVKLAQANREDREGSLPVAIKADRLLVDVVPGPTPVIVHWR